MNSIILAGRADLCALGRAHLYDPILDAARRRGPGLLRAGRAGRLRGRPAAASRRPAAPTARSRGSSCSARRAPGTRHARWRPRNDHVYGSWSAARLYAARWQPLAPDVITALRSRRPTADADDDAAPTVSSEPTDREHALSSALGRPRGRRHRGERRPGSLGRLPIEHLQRYRLRGRDLPRTARRRARAGPAAYPTVADCPGPVDLAMIMVGADRVPAAIDDCVAAGVRVADHLRERLRRDRCGGRRTAGGGGPPRRAGGCGCSDPTASARWASRPGRSRRSHRCSRPTTRLVNGLDRLRQPERGTRLRRGQPRVRARSRPRLDRQHRQRGGRRPRST